MILNVEENRKKFLLYYGPMNSDKSRTVIEYSSDIKNHSSYGVLAFKLNVDTRCRESEIITNTTGGIASFPATTISKPMQALEIIADAERHGPFIDVVVFDELNFYTDPFIISVIKQFKEQNRVILGTGLNRNFRGESFNFMETLISISEEPKNHRAYCKRAIKNSNMQYKQCNKPATFTQRLTLNEHQLSNYSFFDKEKNLLKNIYSPAQYFDPTVIVENLEKKSSVYYVSVCPRCFVIPGKKMVMEIESHIQSNPSSLDKLIAMFPKYPTRRILDFLIEESRIYKENNLFHSMIYFRDNANGVYVPAKQFSK